MPYVYYGRMGDSLHFKGETVVWRGPWHIDIPLDFHLVLNPDADEKYKDFAAMVIAQFISESFVAQQESEHATIEDDAEDL